MAESGGLRDRHKARTRAALNEAALALVAEEGIDAVTADSVAARAGVSRRTFFNYFPRVEDVLTAGLEQITADTVEAFLARPPAEPLRESVRAVLDDFLASEVFEQARVLQRAADHSPATRRFLHEFCDSQSVALEQGLWRRIGPDADPVYVAGLAVCTAAMYDRLIKLSLEFDPTDGPVSTSRHRDRVWLAFDLLFAGFDEAGARRPDPTTPPHQDSRRN